MSLADKRQQIVDALDAAPGVAGYLTQPTASKTGDAWPLYQGSERDDDTGMFAHTWLVGVALPSGEVEANSWVDGHIAGLVDALEHGDAGYVDKFEPANFGDGQNLVYGLVITLRSE